MPLAGRILFHVVPILVQLKQRSESDSFHCWS